jgi:hypothetical protein
MVIERGKVIHPSGEMSLDPKIQETTKETFRGNFVASDTLLQMRLTGPVKAGLVLVALGVATLAGIAIWIKTARTTVADFPISIHPGTVNQEFIADYDAMYVMSVRFDRNISHTRAVCFLGGQELDQSLDCKDSPPLLKFSWQIFRDGQQMGTSGTSAITGSGPMNDVTIVGFPTEKKHRYTLALTSQQDAGSLQIPRPRVRVELSPFNKEDFIFAAATFQFLGLVLCVIGVMILLVSFVRSKFKTKGWS